MKTEKRIAYDSYQFSAFLDKVNECPVCKYGIEVTEIISYPFQKNDNSLHIVELYICPHCRQSFITQYRCNKCTGMGAALKYDTVLEYTAPIFPQERAFEPEIRSLSPQFVKIYNQAQAADLQGLDEIVGIGYRKAIEFLVKDYCIHKCPEEAEKIKTAKLGSCIQNWIDDEKIKTLASRAVWIGNDETHYVRLQPDLDIDDMKRFLRALLGFITSELAYEEAAQISSARG